MLWLYILIAVFALIFLILMLPIGLKASGVGDMTVVLKIGFVKIRLYPPAPKKKKKVKTEKKVEKTKKDEKKSKSLLKEKGLDWIINTVKRASRLAQGVLKDFFGHIIVKDLRLDIKVAEENAADTAVKYGACCSAVYPAVGVIVRAVRFKKYSVSIIPDFDEGAKSEVNFLLDIKIRLVWLAALIIKHGLKGIRLLIELKE